MIIHACNLVLCAITPLHSTMALLGSTGPTSEVGLAHKPRHEPRYAHEPRTYTADQRAVDVWVDGKLSAKVYRPIPGLNIMQVYRAVALTSQGGVTF